MKVLLCENVDRLGRLGDLVEVADGYARNYLLPRALALPASPDAERRIEAEQRRRRASQEAEHLREEDLAKRLNGLSLTLTARADGETLYGSVAADEIVAGLREEHGIELDAERVELAEPIRALGVYPVPVRVSPEIKAEMKVWIVEE